MYSQLIYLLHMLFTVIYVFSQLYMKVTINKD
jgi:hypothetical protein